jgi:hypothetical protein
MREDSRRSQEQEEKNRHRGGKWVTRNKELPLSTGTVGPSLSPSSNELETCMGQQIFGKQLSDVLLGCLTTR